MGNVTVLKHPLDFFVFFRIGVDKDTPNKGFLYSIGSDNPAPHRFMITVQNLDKLPELAKGLEERIQRMPDHRHDHLIAAIGDWIKNHSQDITCP